MTLPEHADSINHDVDGEDVVVKLYDANKGKMPRTGGPYLDEVQAEQAEINRAKREDREPDLENVPPYTGTVLVPASQLTERDVDKSHYSEFLPIENEPVATYVAEKPTSEPDPTQAAWDNDSQKVAALEASVRFNELVEKNNKPDTEPVIEDHEYDPNKEV
jgi:hypothetical protein